MSGPTPFASLGYRIWLAYKGQSKLLSYARQFAPLYNADHETLNQIKSDLHLSLLNHAYETSHFYRDSFAASGVNSARDLRSDSLHSLPFLTKQQIIDHLDNIISTKFSKSDLGFASTGGSSGLPIKFCRDHRTTLVRRAQDYLFNKMIGVFPGTRRAWVWGSPLDVATPHTLKARIANYLNERAIFFYSFDASPEQMRDFVQQLNRHRPQAIYAYPNMLATIAAQIESENLQVIQVPRVVVTAEPLYDWQRQLFSKVFGAETFERYGSREIGTVAAENSAHDGMRIFEPNYIYEVVAPDGREITDGSPGELVITDLYNYAMPLIRYRTGDIVRLEPTQPTRGWRRILEVGGRVVDMITRPDGTVISGLGIMRCLHLVGINQRVRIIQTSPGELVVCHLGTLIISHDTRTQFQGQIDALMKAAITITYQEVNELTYDKSGKYRYVISECSQRSNLTSR